PARPVSPRIATVRIVFIGFSFTGPQPYYDRLYGQVPGIVSVCSLPGRLDPGSRMPSYRGAMNKVVVRVGAGAGVLLMLAVMLHLSRGRKTPTPAASRL